MNYAIITEPKTLHSVNSIITALAKDKKESFIKIEQYIVELRNKDWYKEEKVGSDSVVFVNTKSSRQFFIKAVPIKTATGYGIADLLVTNNVKDDIIKLLSI